MMNNDNNKDKEEDQINRKISELRVAQAELVSGNTQGRVFMRLSPGAVAFVTDRKVAEERVASDLRKSLLEEEAFPSNKQK
jgi:hypothetical protein